MIEDYGRIKAVLKEIKHALHALRTEGKTYTIYLDKSGLMEEEVVEVIEALGKGSITINFKEGDEPVEWYESTFPGVWVGVYRNSTGTAILYTVEVCKYPEIAGAYVEDMEEAEKDIQSWIDAASM